MQVEVTAGTIHLLATEEEVSEEMVAVVAEEEGVEAAVPAAATSSETGHVRSHNAPTEASKHCRRSPCKLVAAVTRGSVTRKSPGSIPVRARLTDCINRCTTESAVQCRCTPSHEIPTCHSEHDICLTPFFSIEN